MSDLWSETPPEVVADPNLVEEVATVKAAPKKKEDKQVMVKLLNMNVYDDCYLAYEVDHKNNVYLVPRTELLFQSKAQPILASVLARCVRPYNWHDEIKAAAANIDDLSLAMLYAGYIEKKEIDHRELIARCIAYGALPIGVK